MENGNKRARLGSRLGFILLSAGCAIGVGNVWKFPYLAGENGGAFFVLLYLFFLAIMGIPIMTVEFTLGRASQRSPVRLYQQLEKEGSKWHLHGYAALAGNYILMMFYTVVSGWILKYFIATVFGRLDGLDKEGVAAYHEGMLENPLSMYIFVAIVIVVGFIVCSFGVQKGLERVTKVMMIALLVLILGLAIYSVASDKTGEGVKFYLIPNIESIKNVGLGKITVEAMKQAFFTLSIGIGNMAIFGSYIGKERSLLGEAVNVAALDSFVAITAGFIIFPACFQYGVNPAAGPDLIFQTLPLVFNSFKGGRIVGSLFFLFMVFAAFSTILTVFENIITCFCELFGISRIKSSLINCGLMLVLCLPCIFGFNLLSGFNPLGEGTDIMALEDFIVSNILLPLGSLIFLVFATHKFGWGWDKFKAEANEGKGLKVHNWMKIYMQFVLPAIIFVLFVIGIVFTFV